MAEKIGSASYCFDLALHVADALCTLDKIRIGINIKDFRAANRLIRRVDGTIADMRKVVHPGEELSRPIKKLESMAKEITGLKGLKLKKARPAIGKMISDLAGIGAKVYEKCHPPLL